MQVNELINEKAQIAAALLLGSCAIWISSTLVTIGMNLIGKYLATKYHQTGSTPPTGSPPPYHPWYHRINKPSLMERP